MIKFNDVNTYEFFKSNYINNNTLLRVEKFPATRYNVNESSVTLEVYKVAPESILEKDYHLKDYLMFTRTMTVADGVAYYLGEETTHEGTFRYVIRDGVNSYWGNPFCKEERASRNEYKRLNSGMLRFYTGDIVEFFNDFYIEQNTDLKTVGNIVPYLFDVDDTINAINSLSLYKIDEEKFRGNTMDENWVKDLNPSDLGTQIYEDISSYDLTGMFRIKGEIDTAGDANLPIFSEIFCIQSEGPCRWVFEDGLWDDRGCWDDTKIMTF